MSKYDLFQKEILSLRDIRNAIQENKVPIVLINIEILNNSESNKYTGHFIVITGVDKNYVYYNDSGPKNAKKNKKVSKEIFEKSREKETTKYSVIVAEQQSST